MLLKLSILFSRYLDDLFNIDNNLFDTMVNRIYPSELQLNKANVSDTECYTQNRAPGARPHVPPVMAEGDFRLMTPLYDNL